jgi:hypothetical protein
MIKTKSLKVKLIACFLPDRLNLIYSRIEVAADARRGGRSCGCPPQVLHNEADAVRSVRLKGKFGRNFLLKTNGKNEKEKDL